MKYVRRIALALLAGVAVLDSTALADGKPFRHLVFKVGVTQTTQTDTLVSGGATGGAQTAHANGGIVANGSITADFLGITADNAFRIQISENTDTRKGPPVAVDVTDDGNVRLPQNQLANVTDEEQMILPMLARYFVTDEDLSAGAWNRNSSHEKNSDNETYRVTSRGASGDITIEMEQRINIRDAQPFDTITHGSITYSTTYKVPRNIVIDSRTHHEGVQGTETDTTKEHFELVTDSFQAGS